MVLRQEEGEPSDSDGAQKSRSEAPKKGTKPDSEKIGGIGFLDVLRVLGGVLLLNTVLSYFVTGDSVLWGYRPWWTRSGPLKTLMVPLSSSFHYSRLFRSLISSLTCIDAAI